MPEKMKILVVDDSPTARRIIGKELEGGGYEVEVAEDGERALRRVAEGATPDLITLDVDMPVMNGFEACSKLQSPEYSRFFSRHEKNKSVPIIMVTANDSLDDRRKGFEFGAADFVAKPFMKGEILNAVNKILRPKARLKNLTALVVDDSTVARRVVTKVLEREGVSIIEADTGGAAFEIMCRQASDIDILITDLMMPKMNGNELCLKVRKELNLQDIPIIFLTGLTEQTGLLDLFKAGGTDYIVKPFFKEELLSRISVHLERAQLTRRLRKTVKSLRKANDEIRTLSITDPLTGCFNRGYLTEQLPKEIDRCARYKRAFTLLMCDIDHFKHVNDTHGHQAGDQVLKSIVRDIMRSIRTKVDWVARYGGEEFVVVLPETDDEGGGRLAERLRFIISRRKIEVDNKEIRVTASFGGVGFPARGLERGVSSESMINKADSLLYRAKEEGRNKVVMETMRPSA
ncbi:MAG: response regulator [Desulfobacterales bacterium]|nr:response regulator [Desulfobacterales bacterium]